MYDLFVGDVGEYLSVIAKQHDPESILLDHTNLNQLNTHQRTFYTSLADIGNLDIFSKVCFDAVNIFYYPPKKWSDADSNQLSQQTCIELQLARATQITNVHNFDIVAYAEQSEVGYLAKNFLVDDRKTKDPQLWAIGCSITFGYGVEQTEKWSYLLSKKLNLPFSNLSLGGSSLLWQSDQICQSDIRKNDVVCWLLNPAIETRVPVINNAKKLVHIFPELYTRDKTVLKEFPPAILDNPTLAYHNVMAVRRAYNFCNKMGAKLIINAPRFDVSLFAKFYNIPAFRQLGDFNQKWVDMGTDNRHPGPKQQQKFAETFEYWYNLMYC